MDILISYLAGVPRYISSPCEILQSKSQFKLFLSLISFISMDIYDVQHLMTHHSHGDRKSRALYGHRYVNTGSRDVLYYMRGDRQRRSSFKPIYLIPSQHRVPSGSVRRYRSD